ncbi:cilia- and flagella-associated protein 157 [Heteronotia binoei]|uniref:cilia- and flagella-associated protein 157 n=1 Tax=Heteronotia binoei TaxID=13085 RepID=UPI002930A28E|nr:cilia- and flagella-associated protein 157 [Heteronotia binoei]
MAPKKKGGRKKEEAQKEPDPEEDIVPEHSRQFYLIQIRDLEGRVARYQKKWDELQVGEDLFRSEYDKIVKDNKEIVAFLKKTLNQRVDEIADLTEQLQNLQHAKDTEKDAFETQLVQLRHEFQETKDQLTSENMALSGKLASLEEFRVQKEELMARFADLEEQLKKQEADHKEYIYNLDKKAVLDKERLKKEMLHRVNVVASEFRKVSDSQMAETTKRAIRENATISLQLTKITDQSLQLMQENDRLKEACAELTKQLNVLEHNEKTLAKMSFSNQKLIQMLTSKCKELQAQVDRCAYQQKAMMELRKTKEALEKQVAAIKEAMKKQKKEMKEKTTDQQGQAKQLQEEKQRRKAMELILRHTAQGLKEILSDCPAVDEQDQFLTYHLWRNDMLQDLLNLLNRGIAHVEDQQAFLPFSKENEEMKRISAEDSSYDKSLLHLKASRIMSHCQLSKMSLPLVAHSMPSLTMLSQTPLLEPLRTYASATEPLMSWKQEEGSKDKEVVLKEEHRESGIAVAHPSEEMPSKPGEEGKAEKLSPSTESSPLGETTAGGVGS